MGIIILSSLILAVFYVFTILGKMFALNFTIFSLLFTLCLILVLRSTNKVKNKKAYILLIPIIILNLTYSIFNNHNLNSLNTIIIPILNLLMAISIVGDELNYKTTVNQIFYSIFETLSNIGTSLGEAKRYIKLKINVKSKNENKSKSSIAKAIVITFSVVLVIIALLSSADQSFASIFTEIAKNIFLFFARENLLTTIEKIIVGFIVFVFLLSFYNYISKTLEAKQFENEDKEKSKDSMTIKMVLLALNLVYLLFVCVQINTILKFTGENINFSNYAREGFFQLMIVSIINIVTILIAKNRWKENSSNLYIKVNSVIMIAFTVILIILSYLRMNEYVKAFGLTFLRISVYFSLFTEILIIVPTLIFILKGKLNLNIIYLTTFLSLYVVFNCINVNNIIANYNVNRIDETGKIDLYYLESIGEDATGSLIKALDTKTLTANQKHDIATTLNLFENKYENNFDIREFNISKQISYNKIKNSNYEEYLLNNTLPVITQEDSIDNTVRENPYTSSSPIVENDVLVAETYDFERGNKYTQEECNKIAKDYLQEIAKTSNVDWVKEYYSKFTVIYESKPVVEVHPNNYWECVKAGIGTADVSQKRESWTEGAYEVTLVRYDDDVQLERALVYVNPKTGKVIAGTEMGD